MFSQLTALAQAVLGEKFGVTDIDVKWEPTSQIEHGDIATSIALRLAKQVGTSPQEIAEVIKDALSADADTVARAEVAGPGYVNIWLTPAAALSSLDETRSLLAPVATRTDEAPVVVEYSSPNIAKPLGIHHILSTVIGQVIANVHRHLGYNVVTVNHLGDWGTQFGKLAVGFEKWGSKPLSECSVDDLLALYVRFHEEAENDASLEDTARETFSKLEQGDKEITAFWKEVVDISLEEIHGLYKKLNVDIEFDHGESMYQDMMKPILDEGMEKGVFKHGDKGAIITEFAEDTKLPPAIVLKGDGATIYHTRDLAVVDYRIKKWHPQKCLYVVDVAQQLYFQQLFEMVKMLGWELPHLEHVIFGRMSFSDRKMSTRKGNILRLDEVLSEAVSRAEALIAERGESSEADDPKALADMMGVGSVVYSMLSQNRKMNLVFDWDKALSFEGNSAPYLQYTHARACSVLRKADGDISVSTTPSELTPGERTLISTLSQFPTVLETTCADALPHKLATYLYQLCQHFNSFYNGTPILKASETERSLRLSLVDLTASVLNTGAKLLTLRLPERM